jgi:hypothetical protein
VPAGEAFSLAVQGLEGDALRPTFLEAMAAVNEPADLKDILDPLAETAPALALEGLLAWGRNRRVDCLWLEGRPWVSALPEGLKLTGWLNLKRTPIRSLPAGLAVADSLEMEGCDGWDGRIPADAVIGKLIHTDRQPQGLTLREWRQVYPDGERPEPAATLDALLATGASRAQALGLAAQAHGQGAALSLLVEALRTPEGEWCDTGPALAFLDEVAQTHPDLAQLGLDQWGRNHWEDGNLHLLDRPWVTHLPDGVSARGLLWLRRIPFVELPPGLRAHWLQIEACPHWNGQIPEGTAVAYVGTPLHPEGIHLRAWHRLHPHGEEP